MTTSSLRPPAIPLVVHDPYLSIWAMGDTIHGEQTRHWTGAEHPLIGLARIDGEAYRILGRRPGGLPALAQTRLEVLPTRTLVTLEGAGVAIELEFASPLLPDDLEVLSRPVVYLTAEVRSTDGKPHQVELYFEVWPEVAVDAPTQRVTWGRPRIEGLDVLAVGSAEQDVLGKYGDDVRIDWGYFYLAAEEGTVSATSLVPHKQAHERFIASGTLPAEDSLEMPVAPIDWQNAASLGMAFDLGPVGDKPITRRLVLAYDDRYSVEFLHRRLRPYWRRNGWTAADLLRRSVAEADGILERCRAYDRSCRAACEAVGGRAYAELCALAYRQAFAAHKLAADLDGTPLYFSKENFSNGCMATVDVAYPAAPLFAWACPALLEAMIRPVCLYAASGRWRFPFAPHDLGRYPKANGQVYGGGERTEEDQMPVEECGNMLLLLALHAQVSGTPRLAEEFRSEVQTWAQYLGDKGFNPENQLCTDDFTGHLAHNANLSLKAILALAAYARLCEKAGYRNEARAMRSKAERFAADWQEAAVEGDHTRLAFDQPDTWSLKYNLVWDRILGLDCLPPVIAQREAAFYKTQLLRYGLPLDSRSALTKLDWEVWAASLAETREDWEELMEPVYRWVNETTDRVPLSDCHWTDRPTIRSFRARSVVGGVFIRLLS